MDIALLIVRLVLAVVFAIAGIAKFLSKKTTAEMLREFSVPASMAEPAALLLPAAELITALLLVSSATAEVGAVVATFLLLMFSLAIAVNLSRGRRPSCQCFGALSARPVSASTLVRNGVLLLMALAIAASGLGREPASAFSWLSLLSFPEKLLTFIASVSLLATSVTLFIVIQLVAQNGRLLAAIDTLTKPADAGSMPSAKPVVASAPQLLVSGSRAPEFSVRDVGGKLVSLKDFLGTPTLLLFSDPQCGPCSALMPTVGRWQSDLRGRLHIAVVSTGSLDANRAKASAYQLSNVLVQNKTEVQTLFEAFGTPTAVFIAADGTIGSRVAQGRDDIFALVKQIVARSQLPAPRTQQPQNALPIGTPAPVRELVDLFGKTAKTAYSQSKATLLVFWNPACGYCEKLLPELREWAARNSGANEFLVVSTGGAEANVALGLPGTILLDTDFSLGQAFNVQGTPSAILIASDGTIGSGLAVGGSAVMTLAKRAKALVAQA
jgi:thiol-disulfide isomerase/thioredoxin/uncharacterized membrane protein YphA (DoxX/SURF4 family)